MDAASPDLLISNEGYVGPAGPKRWFARRRSCRCVPEPREKAFLKPRLRLLLLTQYIELLCCSGSIRANLPLGQLHLSDHAEMTPTCTAIQTGAHEHADISRYILYIYICVKQIFVKVLYMEYIWNKCPKESL